MSSGVSTGPGARVGARWPRTIGAGLVLTMLAVVAGLTARPADASDAAPTSGGPVPPAAATAVPAAPGWYATSQKLAGGIEVVGIQRDVPLNRGQVAIIPRSALHRVRTVMSSEQLVGGYGRDATTNLCIRVHCHAAVNGDRWELDGHDAGRLTGAVAFDNELVATQPRPPSGLAAHLLIGRDGSLDGTIDFQLPIFPEMVAGEQRLPVEVNRQPTPERTSVITRRYSDHTRTPAGTVEYVFATSGGTPDATSLVPVERREGSGPIEPGRVVVAANGPDAVAETDAWWGAALQAEGALLRSGLDAFREVVGGSPLLIDNGVYGFPEGDNDGVHPRTMVGWDDTRVWLVTVDGRQPGWSTGLSLQDSAQLMRLLGATDALNLDGGGSTAFVGFGSLRNRPSDGQQRRVASALVVMPPESRIGPPPPERSLDPACPPGRVPANPFADANGSTHTPAVACMAWWEVTAGAAPGIYAPLRPVRRDQMATFLARYLHRSGVGLPSGSPDAFPDDEGSVHEPWIDALAAMGIIGGRADGRFEPAAPVTRGQMATFLSRAIPLATGAELANTTDFFADDSGDVHEPGINRVTEAAVAAGTADGRYRSVLPVRRDQMASFLARALSATVESGRATPPG